MQIWFDYVFLFSWVIYATLFAIAWDLTSCGFEDFELLKKDHIVHILHDMLQKRKKWKIKGGVKEMHKFNLTFVWS